MITKDTVIQQRGYLTFYKVVQPTPKITQVWEIKNSKGATIGHVQWFSRWRRYCLYPADGTVFDSQCLDTITRFIRDLMEGRRHTKKNNYEAVK